MAGPQRPQRRRRYEQPPEEHADERWLLTYSDMITLLMALFIVMWSISSVNVSKFEQLKASLRSAFSGKVLPNNTALLNGQQAPFEQDGSPIQPVNRPSSQPAFTMGSIKTALARDAARQDADNLRRIRAQIEQFAASHGLSGRLRTSIDERGLVIQLLTDQIVFDTGRAVLKPQGLPLLHELSGLLTDGKIVNDVRVEGNTDDVPVHSGAFRSNWELSTARADAVLEFLLANGVAARRLSVAGYADQRPVATNATAAGRALNRRVNLVVLRRTFGATTGSSAP